MRFGVFVDVAGLRLSADYGLHHGIVDRLSAGSGWVERMAGNLELSDWTGRLTAQE
jgi:hypothetical protein